MKLYDAHNHLQDDRFGGRQESVAAACRAAGVVRMVVNGSCEEDWPAVAALARVMPDLVIPAFGVHPWYVHERRAGWFDALRRHLDEVPGAVVGEIGLDRWILDCPPAARSAVAPGLGELQAAPLAEQEEVFAVQMAMAAERGVAASIHCLQAWGRLHEMLRAGPRPSRGFLLHSYGGPAEMVVSLARLGAYFGFPGYFLHARKARQRAAFAVVPEDRLLAETDAPDQRLPGEPEWVGAEGDAYQGRWEPKWESGPDGRTLNHPMNLSLVYAGLASVLRVDPLVLAGRLELNFVRLFGAG
jgi:TatD DNase family protein